jgi:hypothetical protein
MEKHMYPRRVAGQAYVFAVIMSVLSPTICTGQAGGAKVLRGDEQAIHDYVLTMDKVSKYVGVANKLVAETKTDPVLAEEVKKIGDAKVPNLEKVLIAQQSPHVSAFLKSNGITERDFVMTPLTLFSAQAAIEDQMNHKPVPDFINPENLKFVRDHKSELERYQKAPAGKSSASD